jgi:hypothetical protein
MTETTTPATPAPTVGLLARAFGVIFSPRDTMAAVVASPRWLGILAVIVLVDMAALGWFMSTTVGRQAALDKAEQSLKIFSSLMPPEALEQQRAQMAATYRDGSFLRVSGVPMVSIVVVTPIIAVLYAGLLMLCFNTMLGGAAGFKQLLAVVTHSWMVSVVGTLLLTPLNYFRESLDSATTLRVFVPMLDDNNFLAQLLGNVDLFKIWWIIVLSTGLSVLYKRKTTPIAVSLFAVYAVIALAIAGVAAMLAARS